MNSPKLLVSEIFGPTIQGEGPSMGRLAVFLRLAGCNLACTWCDTRYAWDWKQYDYKQYSKRMSGEEILLELGNHSESCNLLVITGGEPLLQQSKLNSLVLKTQSLLLPKQVEIETAGTVGPDPSTCIWVDCFNVSPKLSNSGTTGYRYKHSAIVRFAYLAHRNRSIFKFAVSGSELDAREVREFVNAYSIPPEKVWLMPLTSNPLPTIFSVQLLQRPVEVAELAIKNGWNYTDRLQVRLWKGNIGH